LAKDEDIMSCQNVHGSDAFEKILRVVSQNGKAVDPLCADRCETGNPLFAVNFENQNNDGKA